MMPKVSVVVPVYNVEKYLVKCLHSICEQTLQEIEILVVNDGSTDSSLQIIKKFAARDHRIVVIDQQNQGLGYARNAAMRIATGKYVSFVDSDDWVDQGMMEAFYLEAVRTDADLVLGTFYEVSANERTIRPIPIDPTIWQHRVPFSWRDNPKIFYLPTPVWDKFYRRSLLEQHEIFFSKETCEDIDFKWRVFTFAQKISTLPEPMYYYRVRSTSLTGGKKVCVDVFRTHDRARRFLISQGLYEELEIEFNIREISEVIYLSWKARQTLIADDITFTAYQNLAKKAVDAMDFEKLYIGFPYLSFPFIFLVLHIKFHDNPPEYRAILQAWENIAARHARPALRLGKFQLERPWNPDPAHDAYFAIDQSRDFFKNLQSIEISKLHYDDDPRHKAAEIANGTIVTIPPVSENSGSPASILARMTKPAGTDALSFIAWTMQPERDKALAIVAAIGRVGAPEAPVAVVKTMDPATWYSLITVDVTAFAPDDPIELRLHVAGVGPFPFYCTGTRLSHFQFH